VSALMLGILVPVTEPDLFVVCKSCGSEVSPYVTECPYCGQRVRKRAPKIGKDGASRESRRARPQRLPRLRRDEIPGIAPEVRPYATIGVLAVVAVLTVVTRVDATIAGVLGLYEYPAGEWWRLASTVLVHADIEATLGGPVADTNLGFVLITMVAAGIFGTLIERRFGPLALVAVFLLSGAAGAGLCVALDSYPAVGAAGAALGLLCAWLVDDRRALRRGDDRGSDLLGVYTIAAALALLSVAEPAANIVATAGGALAGSVCGAVLGLTGR
jgi:membrane associated rhomboid family serine protease